jgi:glucokinase
MRVDAVCDRRAPGELVLERQYENQAFRSLLEVAQEFLRESGVQTPPETGCIAAAGPVADNQVVFTNRDWRANGDELAAALSIKKLLIINDFVAIGYGLLTLDESRECAILHVRDWGSGCRVVQGND